MVQMIVCIQLLFLVSYFWGCLNESVLEMLMYNLGNADCIMCIICHLLIVLYGVVIIFRVGNADCVCFGLCAVLIVASSCFT
ncbi:hypothetical protein ASPTUDRAFT_635640 [Aspergillus tubingensis CBS 134.48]|uniref:Uncharacterized protein n=1 Tax=Aspergillus tubingensis (strain CBS 134.48) TaxID=767770 RepID=A0A1L9N412_ASPTC|nr:hypothetical protein ASPTUDRAFT_635640 [Aspergillus tubingensis CBS 134.48]